MVLRVVLKGSSFFQRFLRQFAPSKRTLGIQPVDIDWLSHIPTSGLWQKRQRTKLTVRHVPSMNIVVSMLGTDITASILKWLSRSFPISMETDEFVGVQLVLTPA